MKPSILTTDFTSGESIGMLLKSSPASYSFSRGLDLARLALGAEAKVFIYLLDDAVKGVGNPEVVSLGNLGAKISVCSLALEKFGIEVNEMIVPAGLTMMSDILLHSDRQFIFN